MLYWMTSEMVTRMKDKVEGIRSEFKILDDEWLFENKRPATPLAEYEISSDL